MDLIVGQIKREFFGCKRRPTLFVVTNIIIYGNGKAFEGKYNSSSDSYLFEWMITNIFWFMVWLNEYLHSACQQFNRCCCCRWWSFTFVSITSDKSRRNKQKNIFTWNSMICVCWFVPSFCCQLTSWHMDCRIAGKNTRKQKGKGFCMALRLIVFRSGSRWKWQELSNHWLNQ